MGEDQVKTLYFATVDPGAFVAPVAPHVDDAPPIAVVIIGAAENEPLRPLARGEINLAGVG